MMWNSKKQTVFTMCCIASKCGSKNVMINSKWYTQSFLIRNGSIRNASGIYDIFKKKLAEDIKEMPLLMRGFKIRNARDDKILLILTFIPKYLVPTFKSNKVN